MSGFPPLFPPPLPESVTKALPPGFNGPNPLNPNQRKNQKREAKRRAGSQALQAVQQSAAPPPNAAPPPPPKPLAQAPAASPQQSSPAYEHAKNLWIQAGGNPAVADLMAHVAIAESGGNPTAHNSYVENGKTYNVSGLWQISDIHGPGNYTDPLVNARKAVELYNAQGLRPWEDSRNKGGGGGWGQYAQTGGTAGHGALAQGGGPGGLPGTAPLRPPPPARVGLGGNSAMDPVPQYTPPGGPAPHYEAPKFEAPKYEPPKRGLEYLALGLSVLFPGSPIASLASGFATGLTEGAQNRYQRAEKTAEEQYKANVDAAQGNFNNAVQDRTAATDAAKATFDNAVLRYNATQNVRARGIDPNTGKPFQVPPSLQRVLPPGANRLPTASDYATHENALATFYTSVGASDLAADHVKIAQEYQRQAIDDANNNRAMAIALYNQQHQDARETMRENAADTRALNRESAADRREAVRLAHEDARATQADGTRRAQLSGEALRAGAEFYSAWSKALKPPVDQNGKPKTNADGDALPAAVTPQAAQTLSKVFSAIDRDSDPAGMAQYAAAHNSDPLQKQLLLDRGRAAELTRRSKALPIIPHAFAPLTPPKPRTATLPGGAVPTVKHSGTAPAQDAEGKPIWPNAAGTGWEHADGTPVPH